LHVEDRTLTYGEMRARAQHVAAWLTRSARRSPARVAIFARRSLDTYLGILGTCWAGGTYVPLNPTLPEARLAQVLDAVEPDAIVVDRRHLPSLTPRLRGVAPVIGPGLDAGDAPIDGDPGDAPRPVAPDHPAYVAFTSGTTGQPKGVTIPVRAVATFIAACRELFEVGPSDRTAGQAEITFDLSVFDMFFTWDRGAALYVLPSAQTMAPLSYLRQHGITVIFTVPSVINILVRLRALRPGVLPGLRVSIFAGEPLPVTLAEAWRAAAPASVLENFYGPTEATVSCSHQRFEGGGRTPSARGFVGIGKAFAGTKLALFDERGAPAPEGAPGELAIGGEQLALGYHGDPERTAHRFVSRDGERWYLTGDRASADGNGFFYLGRLDNQVKVLGYRVELEDVEVHLRAVSGVDAVAVVGWPRRDGAVDGLAAFVAGAESPLTEDALRQALRARLPPYMVPAQIEFVETIPLDPNGKVDRRALLARLEAGAS
jgi:amino acid adenylation domain-containing protein